MGERAGVASRKKGSSPISLGFWRTFRGYLPSVFPYRILFQALEDVPVQVRVSLLEPAPVAFHILQGNCHIFCLGKLKIGRIKL